MDEVKSADPRIDGDDRRETREAMLNERLTADTVKVCLSCGAKQSADGRLPCDH
ncbi:hypothetical protein [Caballeronia sp. HLA56]